MMVLSAAVCRVCDFCLIFVPFGHYDEPEILSYAIPLICPIGADVRQTEFDNDKYERTLLRTSIKGDVPF